MNVIIRRLQALPLRHKLIAIIFFVSGLSSLIGFGIVLNNDLHGLRQQMIGSASFIARTVADYSAVDLAFVDQKSALTTLAVLKDNPDINNVILLDNLRQVFVSLRPTGTGKRFVMPVGVISQHGGSLVVLQPARYRGNTYGYVYLDYSTQRYWRDVRSRVLDFVISSSVTLIIAFLLAMWLQASVSGPIAQLARTAQEISVADDYSRQLAPATHDEIGDLYRAFNDMMQRINQHDLSRQQILMELQDKQQQLQEYQENLERRVAERTQALETANREMEAFSYSVSHDLRAPLRAIDGFSQALAEDYADVLDATASDYLGRVRQAAQHMGRLIDDLLRLSRVSRSPLHPEEVDLTAMAHDVCQRLRQSQPDRQVEIQIEVGMQVIADSGLIQIVLSNLIGNAWKYTSRTAGAKISLTSDVQNGQTLFTVSDNGAGFDMRHASKLFGAFQRLHHASEFEGTGIGLATVQRIILRHNGRVWAEAEPGKGARFSFVLQTVPMQEN